MTNLNRRETEADLKRPLPREKRGRQKERLQALYLLKTGQVQNAIKLPY